MLVLKYLLMLAGAGLFTSAAAIVLYDIYLASQLRRLLGGSTPGAGGPETSTTPSTAGLLLTGRPSRPVRWGLAQRLAICGVVPLLLSLSIVVVPDGHAGVRISQIWGARPGTLYPGVHIITPLIDSIALYDRSGRIAQEHKRGADRTGARRAQCWIGGQRALSTRSVAADVHPCESSAAGGSRSRGTHGGHDLSADRAQLHHA